MKEKLGGAMYTLRDMYSNKQITLHDYKEIH